LLQKGRFGCVFKIGEGIDVWIAFIARHYTTLMVLFRNEPSRLQMRQIERLHYDFEETNKPILARCTVNPLQLARLFKGVIDERFGPTLPRRAYITNGASRKFEVGLA